MRITKENGKIATYQFSINKYFWNFYLWQIQLLGFSYDSPWWKGSDINQTVTEKKNHKYDKCNQLNVYSRGSDPTGQGQLSWLNGFCSGVIRRRNGYIIRFKLGLIELLEFSGREILIELRWAVKEVNGVLGNWPSDHRPFFMQF